MIWPYYGHRLCNGSPNNPDTMIKIIPTQGNLFLRSDVHEWLVIDHDADSNELGTLKYLWITRCVLA